MKRRFAVGPVLGAFLLTLTAPAGGQDPHPREPVLTTPHFAVYSDYHFNLHDALVAAGTARRAGQPESFAAEPDATCFNDLPAAQRAAWNRAVDYYAEIIATGSGFDSAQILPRLELLWRNDEWASGDERTFIVIARSFRSAASPAYERCRWPARDARNRRWIEALQPLLATYEDAISRRLVDLYGTDWQALPIPVDVVETVSWAGGDSISTTPPPGHVWVSSSYPGYQAPGAALEIVFHEASHLLTGNRSPLRVALDSAARAAGQTLPRDLWHAALFYTTGETVRRTLAGTGEPEHTPLLYALNIFGNVRDPIAAEWSPYLDGERSLAAAATKLVERLKGDP
jgi:hypothetical protein